MYVFCCLSVYTHIWVVEKSKKALITTHLFRNTFYLFLRKWSSALFVVLFSVTLQPLGIYISQRAEGNESTVSLGKQTKYGFEKYVGHASVETSVNYTTSSAIYVCYI